MTGKRVGGVIYLSLAGVKKACDWSVFSPGIKMAGDR
jgi:hypothetical protein